MTFLLLLIGVVLGSFLNVVAMRYDPDKFLFSPSRIGGRSHCVHCKRNLRWFELVPIVSYLIQWGRCRRCEARLSPQYFLAETLAVIIFVGVPYRIAYIGASSGAWGSELVAAICFTAVGLILLLASLIDYKWQMIPDEATVMIAVLGLVVSLTSNTAVSFLGTAVSGISLGDSLVLNRIIALVVVLIIFGGLIAFTRGRGMGMGDLKLVLALALLVGWPDILFATIMAFILGAIYGIGLILTGRSSMKNAVSFGPFLALGLGVLIFAGDSILSGYLNLLGGGGL